MKFLDWVKSALYLSLIVLIGFSSYFIWTATKTVKSAGIQATAVLTQASKSLKNLDQAVNQTSKAVSDTSKQLSSVTSGINTTLWKINKDCTIPPCGALADLNKTMSTARGTMGQLEIAAIHENKNLSTLDSQELSIYNQTSSAISGLSTVETGITKTDSDLDTLITSPDITKSIHNFGVISGNFGDMTTDANQKFHAFLYPPKCTNFKCDLAKTFTIIKTASSLAEPAYWLDQILKGAKP